MGRRDRHLQEDLTPLASCRDRRLGLWLVLLLGVVCSINPPLKLADIVDSSRAVELSQVPFHSQEAHHCGPASLLTLLEASGVEIGYEAVAARVYVPGLEGSLQPEMTASARGFGRIAYPLPPEPEALFAEVAAGRPVLVLLNLGLPSRPYWHYAVVVGYEPAGNRVVMRSGTEPRRTQKAPGWLRQWDWAGRWAISALRPDEWPDRPDRERLLQALADFEDAAAPAAAHAAWQNAVDHWPNEPTVWLGLGNTSVALADGQAAEAAYRRTLELAPDHLPARLNLASLLHESGRACAGLEQIGSAPPVDHRLHAAFRELEQTLRAACTTPPHDHPSRD